MGNPDSGGYVKFSQPRITTRKFLVKVSVLGSMFFITPGMVRVPVFQNYWTSCFLVDSLFCSYPSESGTVYALPSYLLFGLKGGDYVTVMCQFASHPPHPHQPLHLDWKCWMWVNVGQCMLGHGILKVFSKQFSLSSRTRFLNIRVLLLRFWGQYELLNI